MMQPGSSFERRAEAALQDVQRVVESAGLTMANIVYAHVYIKGIEKLDDLGPVYTRFFRESPPARAMTGVADLDRPPISIEAVAVRNLSERQVIRVVGRPSEESQSHGILTRDRLFVSSHIHALVTRGVFHDDGSWLPIRYVDSQKAELLFRHKVLELLRDQILIEATLNGPRLDLPDLPDSKRWSSRTH